MRHRPSPSARSSDPVSAPIPRRVSSKISTLNFGREENALGLLAKARIWEAEKPEALAAYRKFLNTGKLIEGTTPYRGNSLAPEAEARKKIETVLAQVRDAQAKGLDVSEVAITMQRFEPLLKEGKVSEALAVLDQALSLLNKLHKGRD
ncbi:MAG: hypothetical protein AB7G93_03115 [Bdellovibrionales bacterium]